MSIGDTPLAASNQHVNKKAQHSKSEITSANEKFQDVLKNVAYSIVPPEELEKQRLRKDKFLKEKTKRLKKEDDREEIIKKIRDIKKRLKQISEFEQKNLGL